MEDSQILRSKDLETKEIAPLIIQMAIPAIIGLLVSAIYNVVDTMFISNLGKSQSAAATISFPIFMIISALGLAIGIGAGSSISRLMGQKQIKKSEQVIATTIITSFLISIIVAFFTFTNIEYILKIFGASETNMIYSKEYTEILVLGSTFTMLNMCFNNMLRAEGSSKMSMYALLLGAILNIILDPIFMFDIKILNIQIGLNMQMKGAAIATVISQASSTILLSYFYLTKKSVLNLNFKYFNPSLEIYKEIMKIGLPTLFIQLLMSISLTFLTNATKIYGDAALSSIGIAARFSQIGAMFIVGFSQGYQPVAGYNFGAKNINRVKEALNFSLKYTSIFAITYTILVFIFAEFIVSLFNKDIEIMKYGTLALRVMYISFPLYGFMMVYNYTFQSLGMPKETLILSLVRQGIFLIPLILILPKYLGFNGIILSQPLADIFTCILTYLFSKNLNKRVLNKK